MREFLAGIGFAVSGGMYLYITLSAPMPHGLPISVMTAIVAGLGLCLAANAACLFYVLHKEGMI
jgi:hypothetical protein